MNALLKVLFLSICKMEVRASTVFENFMPPCAIWKPTNRGQNGADFEKKEFFTNFDIFSSKQAKKAFKNYMTWKMFSEGAVLPRWAKNIPISRHFAWAIESRFLQFLWAFTVLRISKNITLRLSEAFYRTEKSFCVAKWECVEFTWVSQIYRDFLYK